MNILLDVNVVLDVLVPQRGYQSQAETSLSALQNAGCSLFFSASSLDNTVFVLTRYLKRESESHAKLRGFVKQCGIHLLSATGQGFLELGECADLEDALLSLTAKRVDKDCVVLTRDASFDHQGLQTIGYEDVEVFVQQAAAVKQIPLLDLQAEYQHTMEELDHAALSVLAHARYILGPEVAQFEQECAAYLGVKHAIGCASGTDALVLALRALAIQRKGQEYWDRNDLIITTPFTFTATGDAILRAGATPLFVDVDLETFNLDAEKVREALVGSRVEGEGSRVKGVGSRAKESFAYTLHPTPLRSSNPTPATDQLSIVDMIPVHLYGQSCDMDALMPLAQEHGLFVLEDVAQAFGGMWKGQKLGSIGTMGAYSFFPSKNLGGFGDGGLVSTIDDELAELVRQLLKHGGKDKYNVDHIGYNSRIDTLQAALLRVRLKYIDTFNEARRAIAQAYNDAFNLFRPTTNDERPTTNDERSQPSPLTLPPTPYTLHPPVCQDGAYHIYHQYTLRIPNGKRDTLQAHLQKQSISTAVYYPMPLHHMKVFKDRYLPAGTLENAEQLCNEVLSLPMEPLMSAEEMGHIIESIGEGMRV